MNLQWNEDNNIKFFRMSSEMFPFASHAIYGYSLEYAAEELKVGLHIFGFGPAHSRFCRLLETWRSGMDTV